MKTGTYHFRQINDMHINSHPSQFIPEDATRLLRLYASEAERLGELHPEQLRIIYEQNWFNLFVPEEYNGMALDLIRGLQMEEAIAWADGSTGWTVTLCSGANLFVGFLEQDIAKKIFSDRKTCFAGSGHPSGIARKTTNGFEITGSWKYATGAPHATIFTATCLTEEQQEFPGAFWFYKDEVTVHKDWHTIGMIATASNSFNVNNLTVPENRHFKIEPAFARLAGAVYRYPFLQFAETTLAVNSSGMAIRFLELAEEIFEQKKITGKLLNVQLKKLNETRQSFYDAVNQSWQELILNKHIQSDLLNEVSTMSRALAATARRVVDEVYPYCGIIAATPSSEVNRVWRNLHTASQHSLLLQV